MSLKVNVTFLKIMISAILVVSFAVFVLVRKSNNLFKQQSINQKMSSGFDVKSVSKISISKDSQSVVLEKQAVDWVVTSTNIKASQSDIQDLLDSIENATLLDLVSKSKENHETYGVTDTLGFVINLESTTLGKDKKLEFIVGLPGSMSDTCYVRKVSDDNVYAVKPNLRQFLSVIPSTWMDKTIFSYPSSDISRVEVLGTKRFALVNLDGTWKLDTGGTPVNLESSQTQNIKALLEELKGFDVMIPVEITELDNSWNKYQIRVFDKSKNLLKEVQVLKKEDVYFVRVPNPLVTQDPTLSYAYFKVFSGKLDFLFELL